MPTRLCSTARCPDPATYRGRCQRHAKQRSKETHPNRAFYDTKRWKTMRRSVLFNHPLCACGAIAVDVHHIVAIEDGGDPWARSNLKALCKPCHGRLTRAEMLAR